MAESPQTLHHQCRSHSQLSTCNEGLQGATQGGNPYSYLRSLVSPELKVMLGDLDITGGITSGGGSSSTTPTNPAGGGNLDG
uniref:hypothetical protein n=1 Tax=Alloprevotella sp. TaxID=1872471 RepID=UPI003FEE9666